jgi:hypothetical protein
MGSILKRARYTRAWPKRRLAQAVGALRLNSAAGTPRAALNTNGLYRLHFTHFTRILCSPGFFDSLLTAFDPSVDLAVQQMG